MLFYGGEAHKIFCDKAGVVPVDSSCKESTFNDECVAGSFCSDLGYLDSLTGTLHRCRAFCRVDADCGDNAFCADAGYSSTGLGLCMPTCTPFKPCPGKTESTCSQLYTVNGTSDTRLTCRHVGSVDASCSVGYPCQDGYTCVGKLCKQLCDSKHPCSGSTKCVQGSDPCPAGQVCLCK